MWFMSVDARSPPVFVVAERAVAEMKQNDEDEQARDTINKDWSKDQWISGVLERAIGIVARSAEKGQQKFTVQPLRSDSGRYAVWDDRSMSKFYAENGDVMAAQDGGEYFPIRNIDVTLEHKKIIHIQGSQRPDSISVLRIKSKDVPIDKKVCICFEGDGHNIDGGKKKSGMFLYEKMFQDAALCHDVNPNVPAIFITGVLWTHESKVFPTFEDWSVQFLREHVLLVEQLLQYINDRDTSAIHVALQNIDKENTAAQSYEYDFYCWINATRDGGDVVTSDAKSSFDLLQTKTKQHGEELAQVLQWRNKAYSTTDDWVAAKEALNNNLAKQKENDSGLLHNKFYAKVITRNASGIPVVIFAVQRVKRDDVEKVVIDNTHKCSGMWYPRHVKRYVSEHENAGIDIDNFLIPARLKGNLNFEEGFSAIRKTDEKKLVLTKAQFDTEHKDELSGHVLFTLPWLWMNIAFLCQLKSSLNYNVVKKATNTLKMYTIFTRKHSTEIHSRDSVQNPMRMFAESSTSLFSHLCKEQVKAVSLDEDLQEFLQQKCGWTNARSASSPAAFFNMVGARNLITAHTLAKQLRGTTALTVKVDDVKAAFPLAAQVEIEYALECLCRHYYFVQNKTIERDGLMKTEIFEAYKRKQEKELREVKEAAQSAKRVHVDKRGPQQQQQVDEVHVDDAQADNLQEEQAEAVPANPAIPEVPLPPQPKVLPRNEGADEENERWQDDNDGNGYVVRPGFVVARMTEDDITLSYLQKGRVARLDVLENGIKRWFVGVIVGQRQRDLRNKSNTFRIKYVPADTAKAEYVQLLMIEYGVEKQWVLLMKQGEEER